MRAGNVQNTKRPFSGQAPIPTPHSAYFFVLGCRQINFYLGHAEGNNMNITILSRRQPYRTKHTNILDETRNKKASYREGLKQ